MKITVEIPEWAEGRHLYLFAGMELLALKRAGEKHVHVKAARCNKCGKCCEDLDAHVSGHLPLEGRACGHLVKRTDGTTDCGLGINMPLSCAIGSPAAGRWKTEYPCSIEFKEVRRGRTVKG